MNSYNDIRLVRVQAQSPVAFYGPIDGVRIQEGEFGDILLGFDRVNIEPSEDLAISSATVDQVKARNIRLNGTAGRFTLSNIARNVLTVYGNGAKVVIE